MPIGAGLGALLGGGLSLLGSNAAANSQTSAANAQLQLGREQIARLNDVYEREMGVLGDTRRMNVDAAQNTFGRTFDAQRDLLQYGRGNARDMYQRNRDIASNTFQRQRGQFENALNYGTRQSGTAYDLATGAAQAGFDREVDVLGQTRDANIAGYQGYADSGDRARGLRDYEMGLSGSLPSGVSALSLSPAARFAMEQGRDSVEAGAVSGGSARSGATIAALERMRMGMAAQDRETLLDRIGGITDQGLAAQGAIAGERTGYSDGFSNASRTLTGGLTDAANTRAGTNIRLRSDHAGNMANVLGDFGNARLSNSTALGSQMQALMQQYTGNMQDLRLGRLDTITNARNNYAAGVGNAGNNFAQGSQGANQFQANALANIGDAGAARYAGISSAFNNGLNDYFALQQYNRLATPPAAANTAPPANPYF